MQAGARITLAELGHRVHLSRMARQIAKTPEVVNAWNITGEDSWELEIAVADVAHLDAVVSGLCQLAQTSTSIILKCVREHQPMLPAPRNP